MLKVLDVDVRVNSTFELNMLTGRVESHTCPPPPPPPYTTPSSEPPPEKSTASGREPGEAFRRAAATASVRQQSCKVHAPIGERRVLSLTGPLRPPGVPDSVRSPASHQRGQSVPDQFPVCHQQFRIAGLHKADHAPKLIQHVWPDHGATTTLRLPRSDAALGSCCSKYTVPYKQRGDEAAACLEPVGP